ncbi:MAG: energy coupling factor transporter S component ThiW [Bacillota bacterium]|jgi:energy coupling factor transporter S component ThiW|nr:energy coupling factor transporter S component ThiW [Bacillota bacterium]
MKVRNLVFMGILVAIGTLSAHIAAIPVAGSKVFPVQHAINVVAGVFLGPGQAVLVAFGTGLLRNMLGTGTPLAFPGGMIGAFFAGLFHQMTGKAWMASAGELLGTGLIGALVSYPIAQFILGKPAAALTYVVPFSMSSAVGALLGLGLVVTLRNTEVARAFLRQTRPVHIDLEHKE